MARDDQVCKPFDERFSLQLILQSPNARMIHGENGVSQKRSERAGVSLHFSDTLKTTGEIHLAAGNFKSPDSLDGP